MTEQQIDTSYNNEFELQLKEAGYKWFKDNWKRSKRGFQKKFKDKKGIKYFITGYHYNFKEEFPEQVHDEPPHDKYSFDVQFTTGKEKKYHTIDLHFSADFLPNKWRPVTTLKEVEEFYEKAWKNMEADYYELNEY
jgi:hypothetical protein